MKLLLNPATEAQWETHKETGARFKIRPIDPGQYDDLRQKSSRSDKTLDMVQWGANFAVAAIKEWDGIGAGDEVPAECNDINKALFGRKQAINIMPWIVDRATSLDHYRVAEEDAAKNV